MLTDLETYFISTLKLHLQEHQCEKEKKKKKKRISHKRIYVFYTENKLN